MFSFYLKVAEHLCTTSHAFLHCPWRMDSCRGDSNRFLKKKKKKTGFLTFFLCFLTQSTKRFDLMDLNGTQKSVYFSQVLALEIQIQTVWHCVQTVIVLRQTSVTSQSEKWRFKSQLRCCQCYNLGHHSFPPMHPFILNRVNKYWALLMCQA